MNNGKNGTQRREKASHLEMVEGKVRGETVSLDELTSEHQELLDELAQIVAKIIYDKEKGEQDE